MGGEISGGGHCLSVKVIPGQGLGSHPSPTSLAVGPMRAFVPEWIRVGSTTEAVIKVWFPKPAASA